MFYSHTILARKGPLGTVWCAAHLQNRLKKSHYAATDIPSTVDRIMFPEVPIALRMSGHLLLGIVRIYSKKVEYLHQDCNVVLSGLRKAFASIDLTLPDNAMQAPLHSITLPQTLCLDDLDVDFDYDGDHTDHLGNQEDITQKEQFPIATNPFVAIILPIEDPSDTIPMDVDRDPLHPEYETRSPVNSTDPTDKKLRPSDDLTVPEAENVPEHEIVRSGVSDTSPETSHINIETHVETTNEKTILSPIMDGSLHSVGPSPAVQPSSGTPASVASLSEGLNNFHSSVPVALRSTPRVEQPPIEQPVIEQPRPRKRKKQYFDDPVVLSNKFIKKTLEDASDLSRKRKHIPSSALGIWKLNKVLKKDQLFLWPSVTGLCSDLCNIYDKTYISKKSHLYEETVPDPRPTPPPPTTEVSSEDPVSTHPSSLPLTINVSPKDGDKGSDPAIEASPTGPQSAAYIDQVRHVEHEPINITPASSPDIGPASDPSVEMNTGTQKLQTPDLPVETPYSESEGTPRTMPEIPEYTIPSPHLESMTAEDLWFLEADDHSPAGSQGTEGVDSLSVRTRAVAQYLKSQSPEHQSSDLSLNKILEGKRRKLCARMFFETLVLKSYDLIDVKQEVPYGDISLKLTQRLSKAQI